MSKEEQYEKYHSFKALLDEGDKVMVKLRISKEVENQSFSIYDFDLFLDDLLSLNTMQRLETFSMLLKNQNHLNFDLFDQDYFLLTNTMSFAPQNYTNHGQDIDRKQKLTHCKELSVFYNFEDIYLLPEDFNVICYDKCDSLKESFDQMSTLLSLIYISSNAIIKGEVLNIQITGHKNIDYRYNLDNVYYNEIINEIYFWIYSDSSYIDKALIARNIISLHCRYADLLSLDEKTISSIQSNFNLYLKNNVNQYIDLKNKLSEFICDIVAKTGEYSMIMLENLKTNLLAIFGFLFTVILANIVSEKPLDNIFSKDITILLEFILMGSFVYLIISVIEFNFKFKRVCDSYYILKNNYKDVLDESDIENIFNNDQLLENMKLTITKNKRIYSVIWLALLLGFIVCLEIFGTEPLFQGILKLIFKSFTNV